MNLFAERQCLLHWVRSFSFPGSTPVCGGLAPELERGTEYLVRRKEVSRKKVRSVS